MVPRAPPQQRSTGDGQTGKYKTHRTDTQLHQSLGLASAIGCRSTCTGDDLDIILDTNTKEAAHQIPANII